MTLITLISAFLGAGVLFLSVATVNFSPSPEALSSNLYFAFSCFLILISLLSSIFLITRQKAKKKIDILFLVLLHFGLLTLAASEIFNFYFGKNLFLYVKEGMQVSKAFASDEKIIDLPFSIELKNFYIETKNGNTNVDNYVSDIVINSPEDKAGVALKISVNNPAFFSGWNIYQYDAGIDSVENSPVEVEIEINGQRHNIFMQLEKKVQLPNGLYIQISNFSPALFKNQEDHSLYVKQTEIMINPAYLFEYLSKDNKFTKKWVWQKDGQSVIDDIKVRVIDHRDIEYSVFSVTNKPARSFSYLGMVLASLGLICFSIRKFTARKHVV